VSLPWPALRLALAFLAFLLAVWLLDRAGLWAERRGWIYWRKRKPRGNALGAVTLELQKVFESGKATHVIEAKQDARRESPDPGSGPA
jgi:hypothetical protein